ncbi:MAG TPA: hypothetical protein EYG71_08080 [Leucothrix sp.]|nr:hypothetical protein [Leucothrix sp.]
MSACNGDNKTTEPTNNNDTTSSCTPEYANNLLKNPKFTQDQSANKPLDWLVAQHIGEPAFDLTVENGIATVKKVSEQPWFTLSQNIDVLAILNKTIEISADLKLNLTESKAHAFKAGGGLQVLIYGKPDDPLGSEQLAFESTLDNEPRLGVSDWKTATIILTIPKNATKMTFGFLHQANGEMSIRNPSLRIITKTCP